MAKKRDDLTDKQRAFVREYLVDMNATQAAVRAGYSEKAAPVTGCSLVNNVKIREQIQKAMDERSVRTEITADNVLKEIAKMAFSNMSEYIRVTENGEAVVDLSLLTRDQAAAIQEVVVDEYSEGKGKDKRDVKKFKFKLADKGQNLERLGKHLKLFTDKHEHSSDAENPFTVKHVFDFSKIPDKLLNSIESNLQEHSAKSQND